MTGVTYTIEVNQEHVSEALSLFEFLGGNTSDALRVAINRAAPRVRTAASAAIRTQVRLKAAYVKDRLTLSKATRNKPTARLSAASRGILLSRYSTDSNVSGNKVTWLKPPPLPKQGPRVKVKPDGKTAAVTGKSGEITGKPFYMVLKNSRALAIVGRRLNAGNQGGKIKVFYAPSVSQVFNTVRDDVLPEASNLLENEILDAIRFLLAKKMPQE